MSEPQIDYDLLDRWLDMLESGEYEQARYGLRHDDRYCCLGLYCLAAGEEFVEGHAGWELAGHNHESEMPPYEVEQKLGSFPNLVKYSTMNDNNHATFEEIAAQVRIDFKRPKP